MIRFRPDTTKIITSRPRCKRSVEERMASDIREMAFSGETVSEETLVARGWPEAAVRRLGATAVAIARRQSVRQVA